MGNYGQECSQLSAEGETVCRHGNRKGVNYFLPQSEESPLQRQEAPVTGSHLHLLFNAMLLVLVLLQHLCVFVCVCIFPNSFSLAALWLTSDPLLDCFGLPDSPGLVQTCSFRCTSVWLAAFPAPIPAIQRLPGPIAVCQM